MKVTPDGFRSRRHHFIEQSRVEGAGGNGIDVDIEGLDLEREGFGETNDGGL